MSNTSNIEKNKETIRQLYDALGTGDIEKFLAFLDDAATWWVAGSMPMSGTYTKQKFREFLEGLSTHIEGPFKMTVLATTAEGERVAAEAESLVQASNGRTYNNFYHFLFEFRNGKILRVKEYMDTMHVHAVFHAP